MSSEKARLQIRMKRLQEMYKQLGRDPNAKGKQLLPLSPVEYEIKSLVSDYDKIVRKQNARLKKGKH